MLTLDDLKNLTTLPGPCLTIIHSRPANSSQVGRSSADLNNAIREADSQMTQEGLTPVEREEMLRPVRAAASTSALQPGAGSLVIFRSRYCALAEFWPEKLTPRVCFSKEFLILPLLPALLQGTGYWLLALSVKGVRLFRGSAEGLTLVPMPRGVACSLSEYGGFDPPDHSLRGRSSAGASVGKMKGVQFGTSNLKELQPDYLYDFFKAIDRGIRPILSSDGQPLILTAVQRELAIYRKVNSYHPTLDEAIQGSPAGADLAALHAKASRLLAAASSDAGSIQREVNVAVDRNLLITRSVDVVYAAAMGRVRKLIISPATSRRSCEPTVNWAAVATLHNSGSLSLLDAPQTRDGCAAILRFRDDIQVPQPTLSAVAMAG